MNKVKSVIKGAWMVLAGVLLGGQLFTPCAATQATPQKATLQSLSEPQRPSARRALPIKGYKSHSGTKILFIRNPGLPMFDVHVSFAAGSAHTHHQPGLAALTFSLLNEGVDGKDINAIQETFDQLGARLGMGITADRASFSLRSLSDEARRAPALELFAQMLGKPLLPEQSLSLATSQLLHFLDTEQASHATQADQALHGLMFPKHGYSQSVYGTRVGLASVTRDQVQDFHRSAYAAGNALIILVGDLTEDEAQRIGAQISNALPQGPAVAAIPSPGSPDAQQLLRPVKSSSQAYLRLAQPGVLRNSPDSAALQIANRIFTARLMEELRERRGMTYDVQARLSTLQAQSTLVIELQTRPELADAALAHIKGMFRDFLIHGPTQKELDDTKTWLAGSAPLRSASNAQIVRRLLDIGVHDLPLDLDFSTQRAQELNLDAVKKALNQHLDAERWNTVILGPTTNQQPLPNPVQSEANTMCRATTEFVAS
ncbi:zinc protease [Pseudomonas reinekei]|uniref:Insulinase family protein n=1 Tax=Pseudomonas reinekei TaxID=395598 RepID=A0A1H0Q629_PSERE|nr:pitrilysin family protein [Pseudomonas reinekei]KAB0486303.1 insulinase family protein [Pseudomonas reinekei]OLU03654.1 peptidase M16 [Pseudomonas reinekei]SDP12813.1 zinc protease [Pseudomonas reinekei]